MQTNQYQGKEMYWKEETVNCRQKRKLLHRKGIDAEIIKSIVFAWDEEQYAVVCGVSGSKLDLMEIRTELSIPTPEAGTIKLARPPEVRELGYEIGAVGPWGSIPVYISRALYRTLTNNPSRRVDIPLSLDRSLLLSGSDFLQQAERAGVLFPGKEEEVMLLDLRHRKGHERSFFGSWVEYKSQSLHIFDPRKEGVCLARQERYGPRYLLPLSQSRLEHHLKTSPN